MAHPWSPSSRHSTHSPVPSLHIGVLGWTSAHSALSRQGKHVLEAALQIGRFGLLQPAWSTGSHSTQRPSTHCAPLHSPSFAQPRQVNAWALTPSAGRSHTGFASLQPKSGTPPLLVHVRHRPSTQNKPLSQLFAPLSHGPQVRSARQMGLFESGQVELSLGLQKLHSPPTQ